MNDQKSINSLFDFSDLRKKADENQVFNKFIDHSEHSNQNQALLRAFKELRQKLKLQTREINSLKDELKIANIKCRQNEEALSATLTGNLELKQKVSQSTSQNQELKKKLLLMKETVQNQANYYQEVQFTKQALMQMKNHTDELEEQRNKLMEISLSEKMELEQQIGRLKSKIQSDSHFIEQLQANFNKARETIIKQENQIKKLNINFEEEVFNKNWSKDNFETQHLLNTIKELQREINVLKAKSKKDKEKKAILEDRIIELEEVSGFHNVKAQTFEGEIDMITKKYTKLDKKYKELKNKLDKINAEKLTIEENLSKLTYQSGEFASKLKGFNIPQVTNAIQQYQTKISLITKKYEQTKQQFYNIQSRSKQSKESVIQNDQLAKNQYFSFQPNTEEKVALGDYNKSSNIRQKCQTKGSMYGSNMTFGDRQNEQNQTILIQNRIKRQRQQMQRKIKQKMLHRRLQASAPNQQFKLRGDYIKTYIDKHY